jgi:peptide/nickel transport system ATP-binding protein
LQITEAIRLHRKVTFEAAKAETLQLFEKVKLSDPARIFNAYPHQISGGQKQRVMIAMALSCQPKILIADEPTTALDPTVQKATLDLLRQLKDESGLSMLFISHDIGVIARICDRLAIMYQGKIVETGLVTEILHAPRHPYTKGLLACRPVIDRKWHRLPTIADYIDNGQPDIRVVDPAETKTRQKALYDAAPVMEVTNLTVRYPATKNWLGQPLTWLAAVDNATFSVYPGETFGIAGESGCGKTTLGRAIARLTPATSGAVKYEGTDLLQLSDAAMRRHRRDIQMIFQDPYASLNPGKTIGAALTEPMEIHQLFDTDTARQERAVQLLETVGLQADHLKRLPHSFSGGQRQRICIARALAVEPKFLICDEIVSSLDVSVQATILNLLADLQVQFGLTYLFISHDLGVIRQMCDRLLVLKNGAIETLGVPDDLFRNPPTEYVRQLIGAVLA